MTKNPQQQQPRMPEKQDERASPPPECTPPAPAALPPGVSATTALKPRSMGTSADCSHAVLLKRNARGYHRRSQTIVAAGNLELQQLQRLMQLEVLKHDLESKSKELEESQEEAHLAALIGQSLLQRTEEMGAEIESTAIELLNRAENAEHEVKILEAKLSKAYSHIRSMEVAKARTVDESDEISQELETLRIRMQVLKAEATKAHDETQQIRSAKEDADEELEATKDALAKLQTAHARLMAEWRSQDKRIQELEAAEGYNLEHISRLEIENQSICLQHRQQERKEKKLVSENETMASKMLSQHQFMRGFDATKRQLEKTIEALSTELDDMKDALVAEQLRIFHLTKLNKDLQDRADDFAKQDETRATLGSPNSSAMLRRGSLFYELSMQLKEEMRHSTHRAAQQQEQEQQEQEQQEQQEQEAARQHLQTQANDQHEANQPHSQKRSPRASAANASAAQHKSAPMPLALALDLDDNNTDANEEEDEEDEDEESKRYYAAATMTSVSKTSSHNLHQRSQDEQDILKEFFMLTAAAVKIAGGGLGNDTCNILNEDLYEEALDEGLTFDQFHKWLERRLEGAPELSVDNKAAGSSLSSGMQQPRRHATLMKSF